MQRILIVNDFPEARAIYERHLRSAQFDVITANDAATAIDLALRHTPAVIVMDDGLPDLSGLAAAAVLKKHSALRAIPQVMIGGLLSGARRAAEHAGAEGFVAKPCGEAALIGELRRVLAEASETAA
jgi:CheY-like chemotaxis protein